MRKKYLSALLFGALLFASAGTFTSCKDYDDDIAGLQSQIDANKAAIEKLQELVNAGKYVTGVEKTADGIKFTFNSGDPVVIDLAEGQEGQTITFGEDGELIVDGKATGIKPATSAEKAPVKAENGEWVFLNENGEYESTGIPVSGVTAVQNDKKQWVLTIVDADGKSNTITLPTAASAITETEALGVAYKTSGDAYYVANFDYGTVSYNFSLVGDLNDVQKKWNAETSTKKLVKGQALSTLAANSSNLLVRIAPATLDASELQFSLVNSKMNEAPIELGTPKAFEGLLTRSESNGLWLLPIKAKDNLTYENAEAYKNQFAVGTARVTFALHEKEGFNSGFDINFQYNSNVPLTASVKAIKDNIEMNEPVTVTFDNPSAVYDAHLHFEDADVIRWGIQYDGTGTTFTVTKMPDNQTTASFELNVHYVNMNGSIVKTPLTIKVNKTYSKVVELDAQTIAFNEDNSKNKVTSSLTPMFDAMGGADQVTLWKKDVKTHSVKFYQVEEGKDPVAISGLFDLAFDRDVEEEGYKDITKVTVNVANGMYPDRKYSYYALVEFYDNGEGYSSTLNTLKVPFNISIPALTDLLKKEQVVFGGTNNGTGVMNEADLKFVPTNSAYSLQYAFNDFANTAFNDDSKSNLKNTIKFEIDKNQKIKVDGVDTPMTSLATINDANKATAYVQLAAGNGNKAYNQPINILVTEASYLGHYAYTDAEKAAAAFTMKLVSPIKEGTLTAKDGADAIITVTATEDGTAKIKESDLLAKTYAGVAYNVFPHKSSDGTEAWTSPYIAGLNFKSTNENVFTVEDNYVASETVKVDGKDVYKEGYIVIKPQNVAYEDAVPVEVTVTDAWGYKKVVKINVKVLPNK